MSRLNEKTASLLEEYGPFLTVGDLTEILKTSRYVIDRMLKTGQMPAARLGGQYRIRVDDFMKWWDGLVKDEQRNVLKNCLPV